MSKYTDFLALAQRTYARFSASPLVVRAASTGDTLAGLFAGARGGLAVEFADGASVPLPSDAATQTTLAAVAALLAIPTTHNEITESDDTDLTALADVGVIVGGAGDLVYRLTGAPSTTVTLPVVAGQFVPGQFTRVMAATSATDIVGVAR